MAAIVLENRKELETVTPMMKQYLEVKEQYEDYVLFYRLGDFYECFFEDAIIASRELELTLTARDCGDGKRAAMCGVPFHKSDVHIGKLVERGIKVAICEQIGDPKAAVGLVKREVTRVITPGTVTDSSLLNEGKNNFLMSVCLGKGNAGVATADISTGEVFATYFDGEDCETLIKNEIAAYQPSEIILNIPSSECKNICSFVKERFNTLITDNAGRLFVLERAKAATARIFGEEISKLERAELTVSVGSLLLYIEETQKTEVAFAKEVNVYSRGQYLDLDMNTRRNLELTESMRNKEKRGSLLWVLDKTKTAMGARLLRSWLLRPLVDPAAILRRQSAVGALVKSRRERDELSELLSTMLDIERLTAKAVYGTANARDLRAIYLSIENLPVIKAIASTLPSDNLRADISELDTLDDMSDLLARAIVDTPPLTIREGGMIREGFNADVDYYRSIKDGATDFMASIVAI